MRRRLASALLVAATLASLACGSSGGGGGASGVGNGIHTIDATVTVTIASPTSWLAPLPAAARSALRAGRPYRPCPAPPGPLASVVDDASVQVRDGGGAMVAVTTLAGSTLTLADGHARCTLHFTVRLPVDDHFTFTVGSVPAVRVDGQHARHDGDRIAIPFTG